MSDSMREQLLKAGFKESKKSKKAAAPKSANANRQKASKHDAAAEQRKKIKAEIKTIIESNKINDVSGDIQHSYIVGKRIKQLFVNEAIQQKLIAGELVITRLNGSTFVVPSTIGEKVKQLNPDWVVVKPNDASDQDHDDYADYQVPDDLKW